MRDSFDTYFLGWWLFPGLSETEKTAFTDMIIDVGQVINADPALVQEWKLYQFDEKRNIFAFFFKKYLEKGQINPKVKDMVAKTKTHLKI